MRRYEAAWNQLKTAPVNTRTGLRKVTIRGRPAKMNTIVQGILKEKARENIIKKHLGLEYYGELIIVRRFSVGETDLFLLGEMKKNYVKIHGVTAEQL